MIKIYILSLLFCVVNLVAAQNPLTFGVKAGLNLSDYYGDLESNDIKLGYNVGLTIDYRLTKKVYLVSGLELTSKGTKVKSENTLVAQPHDPSDITKIKESWNPLYLQVPLHIGYIVEADENMLILFHMGPYVAYGIGGKMTQKIYREEGIEEDKTNVFGDNSRLKRWDAGIGIGAGFQFQKIGVNFGYDLGLLNVNQKYLKLKNNAAHISFAYRFR